MIKAALPRELEVRDVMTADVACLRADDTLDQAWEVLHARGISGAPVLDKHDALIGVVSKADLADPRRRAPDAKVSDAMTRVAYAVSKSGLHALVRHVASRWGKRRIRANAVAPGLVMTDPVRRSMTPAQIESVLAITRSDRLGEPDDIASAVAFLCSDDGAWINGQVLSVDGGVTMR